MPEATPTFSILDVPILFEDDALLVVNKPAGLPTQSTVDKRRPNLYDILRNSKKWPYLGLHHRLDVPTSGALLLVKDQRFNKAIAEGFKNRTIHKKYLCLTRGVPQWTEKLVENHIAAKKLKGGKTKMEVVHSGGDLAQTKFRLVKHSQKNALVEAMPLTGRMHQIRIHLATEKLPIVGDALYGRVLPPFKRLLLHAECLNLIHPKTSAPLEIHAPLPADFMDAMNILELQI